MAEYPRGLQPPFLVAFFFPLLVDLFFLTAVGLLAVLVHHLRGVRPSLREELTDLEVVERKPEVLTLSQSEMK